MEIMNTREKLDVRSADLANSRFEDVNLQGSTFTDVNLAGTRFADVNLSGVAIEDANLTGMIVNGMLVTDLIRAFRSRPQLVLYAKDLARMREFYLGVFHLEVEHAQAEHVILASSGRRVCDGYDPEGNVVQFREAEHKGGQP